MLHQKTMRIPLVLLGLGVLASCQEAHSIEYYLSHTQERRETHFRCQQDILYFTTHSKSCHTVEIAADQMAY